MVAVSTMFQTDDHGYEAIWFCPGKGKLDGMGSVGVWIQIERFAKDTREGVELVSVGCIVAVVGWEAGNECDTQTTRY